MENNSTKDKYIKLEGVEIRESTQPNGKSSVHIQLQLPVSMNYAGKRSIEEYRSLTNEEIRVSMSEIFQMIDFLSEAHMSGNILPAYFSSYVTYLSKLGSAYAELLEIVEDDFDRYITTGKEQKWVPPHQAVPPQPPAASDKPVNNVVVNAVAEQPPASNLAEHHLQIWASKLAYVLGSDKVSKDVKSTLGSIVHDAANEVGLHIDDPNIVKPAFLEFMKKADFGYGKGILQSIQTIIDDLALDTPEITQFDTRFTPASQESAPLDLSACEPEQLNTRLSELPSMNDFACALSGLLNNPLIPQKLYEAITDEFTAAPVQDTPENILLNLKQMKKKGKSK